MRQKFSTATDQTPDDLHNAMLDAFSDYLIPMKPGLTEFQDMLTHRSFDPGLSRVAISGNRVIAFWFIGRRGDASYLISSGCAPEHRRRGLSRELGHLCLSGLRRAAVRTLQLEVIVGNDSARSLYASLGFAECRHLSCFTLPVPTDVSTQADIATDGQWCDLAPLATALGDWHASWQNDDLSIQAAGAHAICATRYIKGELAGYAVLLEPSGTIAQIAVHPKHRGKGWGQALIRSLQVRSGNRALRILNADAADMAFIQFVSRMGGKHTLDQVELMKVLHQENPTTH